MQKMSPNKAIVTKQKTSSSTPQIKSSPSSKASQQNKTPSNIKSSSPYGGGNKSGNKKQLSGKKH